ncbi:hypothetical protein GIB67_014004 [Kingdonia uniflora]|uniref:GH18 domain-containing protein n=1 Tax=Kingdonia uniflora TaxID=39325 RepID=A0A7J7L5G2_9MAGN|nr:hypothetical protein GIB67_014004 [Kingdonia uniflora]
MAGLKFVFSILIFVFSMVVAVDHESIKSAYWPSWDYSTFPASAIDTSLFTHIFYAFLMPDAVSYKLMVSKSECSTLANFTSTLKPKVKTILSIGGGDEDPNIFARMAATKMSRKSFINSSIEVGRKYGFDGLDLDWEFPKTPEEMQDLGELFVEWRAALKKEATDTCRPPLLLTAAVYFASDFFLAEVHRAYHVPSIKKNLDWINVMCYDYRGSWDTSSTGAHAALFDPASLVSTSDGLKSWIEAGVPRKMLVMGLPLYGHTWQLESHHIHGVGAPAVGVGPGINAQMTFSEVMDFNNKQSAVVGFDPVTVSMYSYAGTSWIGYDGPMSITLKIGFARAFELRGYFFWAVSGDKDWKISKQASMTWGP